jgi:hypothetical protein
MSDVEKNILQIAESETDQELLDFYNNQSMQGDISLSLNRDPSFFASVEVEGSDGKVMIARASTDHRVTALGHICAKPCYVNAHPQPSPVGYLSSLRIEEKLRGSFLFIKCFQYLKKVHGQFNFSPYYLTTIMEDNEKAKKILESGRAGLPKYNDFGPIHSYLLKVGHYQWLHSSDKKLEVRKAKSSDIDSIIGFLNETGKEQRQFFPYYSKEDLTKPSRLLKGFQFDRDLYLCFVDNTLVGTLGVWDQSHFRRWYVKAYSARFQILKPFYNLYAYITGKPRLPQRGHAFHYSFLNLMCIKNDDPQILKSLLQKIWNDFKKSSSKVLCAGFHIDDTLEQIIKKHPHLKIQSRLYVVNWQDGEEEFKKIDQTKIPYLEIGSL